MGFPGAPMGMSQLDPSIGGLLKNLGYATGQFGKNHVGDRNETLPTVNGFDEFFGNLYHLNADWVPTLCAIAGEPDVVAKLKTGYKANGIDYKVHLDGYDQSKFLTTVEGSAARNNGVKSARNVFFCTDDDGLLVAMRHGDYKYVYAEQRLAGTMGLWAEPFTHLRLQKIYNLFQDPFERADFTSNTYWDWNLNQIGAVYGAMQEVFDFAATFEAFPPRAFPPSFVPTTIMDEILRQIKVERKVKAEVAAGKIGPFARQ